MKHEKKDLSPQDDRITVSRKELEDLVTTQLEEAWCMGYNQGLNHGKEIADLDAAQIRRKAQSRTSDVAGLMRFQRKSLNYLPPEGDKSNG